MPKVVTIRSIGPLWLACVATSVINRRGFMSIYSHSAELRRPSKVVNVTTDSLRLLCLHPLLDSVPSGVVRFLSITPGTGRRTRSPRRRRWPESTAPKSALPRRDYVPRHPRLPCRSNQPLWPRRAPPNQYVGCPSYHSSFLSPRPSR